MSFGLFGKLTLKIGGRRRCGRF